MSDLMDAATMKERIIFQAKNVAYGRFVQGRDMDLGADPWFAQHIPAINDLISALYLDGDTVESLVEKTRIHWNLKMRKIRR